MGYNYNEAQYVYHVLTHVSYGDTEGQQSVRINKQWRICFVWTPSGPTDVEIIDYH